MALPSLKSISIQAKAKWPLFGVAVTHRLGRVPTGEESILIAVSSGHRREAWEAAEWILEEVKRKTEIWKRETYEDPEQEPQWKANEDSGIAIVNCGIWLIVSAPSRGDIWTIWLGKVDVTRSTIQKPS